MNNKPVLGRLIVVAIIIAVFAWSMFPLNQQDFYKVLRQVTKNNVEVEKVIELAKNKQNQDKNLLYFCRIEEQKTNYLLM